MATKLYKLLGIPYTIAKSAVAVPLTGVTTETTLATIIVPGGAMGPNGEIRVNTIWSWTSSANSKTYRVRFGGITVGGSAATTTQSLRDQRIVMNRNSESSQVAYAGATAYVATSNAIVTTTFDTTADVTILIQGTLASAAETMRLEAWSAEVVYGA